MTMSSKENDTLLFDWMSGNLWDISWTLYLIYICFDIVLKIKHPILYVNDNMISYHNKVNPW